MLWDVPLSWVGLVRLTLASLTASSLADDSLCFPRFPELFPHDTLWSRLLPEDLLSPESRLPEPFRLLPPYRNGQPFRLLPPAPGDSVALLPRRPKPLPFPSLRERLRRQDSALLWSLKRQLEQSREQLRRLQQYIEQQRQRVHQEAERLRQLLQQYERELTQRRRQLEQRLRQLERQDYQRWKQPRPEPPHLPQRWRYPSPPHYL